MRIILYYKIYDKMMLMHYINLCFNKITEIIAEMHCHFHIEIACSAKGGATPGLYMLCNAMLAQAARADL